MRRLVLTTAVLLGLALPAAAGAGANGRTVGDGTLVIQNGDNGEGILSGARPVVTLVVTGFVIGKVTNEGKIRIYDLDPTDQAAPEVTGAGNGTPVSYSAANGTTVTGTQWIGSNFRFRAVDGTFRIQVYGSGVYVFAGGRGRVWMTGNASGPDGQYSFNGDPFKSLPSSTPATQPFILAG